MKIAMLPRDIAPAPDWIVPALSLASIWFIYAAFGWTGVALMGALVAAVISLLIILNRRQ
jgi:hypothetical protein